MNKTLSQEKPVLRRPPLPGPRWPVLGPTTSGPYTVGVAPGPWAYYAFTDDNFAFTLENIQRFFVSTSTVFQEDGSSQEVRTYLLIFWRSLKLAIISTLVCLVLAYPLAYIMARAKPRTQKIFLTIIMIPMWMTSSSAPTPG